ncbi:MAG: hypothetical protein K2P65_14620 [Lachnospiraceae bacterium]|nr:hypothetical protein [Lachnospiraceae bacterium]
MAIRLKKVFYVIIGAWSAIMCFVSPIWLTMIFSEVTGLIYQYDGMANDGVAWIVGLISLFIWLLIALLPIGFFVRRMREIGRKHLMATLVIIVFLILLCLALCGFDMIAFLYCP